ncbi:MAG: sigma-70 family RNA polymerase sigma factor [Planctomycetota bacterium]|nr:sigma-70 family RNA polymerase sigma factor [Planctomycetota bacterium]
MPQPELDLERLVREHQAELWRYLRYLGSDAARAEDLVQETFLRVWRRPFEERNRRSTAAYLRTVARNLFVSDIRRRRSRPVFQDLDEADAAWNAHAGGDGGERWRAALTTCLETLTDRARQVLGLFYGARRSRAAVGREAGMTEHGVKTLLRRTRSKLRTCIERKLHESA